MGKVISIPILPHLKKIILKTQQDHEPVKAELSNMLGLQIYSLLHDKTRESIVSPEKFKHNLSVEICYDIKKRNHRVGRLILINKFYSEYFKFLMFSWMIAQYEAGIPSYQGIKNFLDHYGILEEEYSYDTGYRAWLRFKNDEHDRLKKKKVAILS